jgi:membrane fusion protein (multidrug efflux system)
VTVRGGSILSAALLLAACSSSGTAKGKDDAAPGVTPAASVVAGMATVTSESFSGAIDAIGVVAVRPGHIASLGAPGAARVSAVRVAVGDRVGAGTVLVELDPAPFDAAVQGAAAALLAATRNHERAQRLVDAGIAPRKDLDLATSDLAQAIAASATTLRLRTLATLRSPIAGVVTRLAATLGASVDGTASLVDVADPRAVDIVLNVSAGEAAAIARGAAVSLTSGSADGGDSLGTGVVSTIGAAIDTATRTFAVRVAVSKTARALRIGESVNGRIALETHTAAILVPANAVVPDGDDFRVFVVDEANVAHAQAVTIGARQNGRVEILSGLKVGQKVVTDGAYQVDDGVHIVPKKS